jgi:hypothetical protein
MSTEGRIVTSFDYPPIPVRCHDWSAVREDYDGAEDAHDPIGTGRTRSEAIAELLWLEGDDYAYGPDEVRELMDGGA